MASTLRHDRAHRTHIASVAEPTESTASCRTISRPSHLSNRQTSFPNIKAQPHPATVITATYDADETEYMAAVQQFKTHTGRLFPTCSDMLSVAKSLGYARPASAGTAPAAKEGEGL